MNREIILPENNEHWLLLRSKDITSTDVSSLFDISPYCTKFEMWFRKKDASIVEIDLNERMKWGIALQDAIAGEYAKENKLSIIRMDEYIRIPEFRIGSSFDFSIESMSNKDGKGILEIKNVDGLEFKNKWLANDEGDIEPPFHIQLQIQHQLLVSGRCYGYIVALVGGNKVYSFYVEANQNIFDMIKKSVKGFWDSIDNDSPPEPDFSVNSDFICSMYQHTDPGKIMDASDNAYISELAEEYHNLTNQISDIESKRKEIKAKLLINIDDNEKVIGDCYTISSGMTKESYVNAYTRKPYRNFRIYWKG